MRSLQVATGKAAIPCDDAMVIAGSIQPTRGAGQQGELRATALVVRADVPVCIVSCDVLAVPRELADRAAGAIEAACGIPFGNVLICATHTHHAPSTFTVHAYEADAAFCQGLEAAIVAAAQQANTCLDENGQRANAVEAELGFALGQEATVGANSRLLLKDGSVTWTRHDPADTICPTGPFDPDLPVVAFRRPEGQLAALVFNHSTHNIGRCGPGARSPGFYGIAAQELEQALGTTALFLPGAFGSTHNLHVEAVEAKTRIRAAVEHALGQAEWGLCGPVAALKREFEFRVRHFDEAAEDDAVSRYCRAAFEPQNAEATIEVFRATRRQLAPRQGEVRRTWLQAIRLGHVVLVGVPGEMFAELGLAIRRRSPFRHTFVVGLANDEIGYIPDQRAFDHGGYQVWTGLHSVLSRGDGERMVEAALGLLDEGDRPLFLGGLSPCAEPPSVDTAREPVLRELSADDALGLQTFYNTLSVEARRLFRPIGWNITLEAAERVCASLEGGSRYDLVLDAGSRIVGWAFLTRLDAAMAHLGIGIHHGFTGSGFGRRLMEGLIAHARRRDIEAVELCHVADNARAHRLYEACGFATTGTRAGPDGLQYVDMRVTLRT